MRNDKKEQKHWKMKRRISYKPFRRIDQRAYIIDEGVPENLGIQAVDKLANKNKQPKMDKSSINDEIAYGFGCGVALILVWLLTILSY